MSVTQQVPLEQMNWENPELKSLPDDSSKYCREFAIFSIPYIRDISGMDPKKNYEW